MDKFEKAHYNVAQLETGKIMDDFKVSRKRAGEIRRMMLEDEVYLNSRYQVALRRLDKGMIHLSIKRLDREPIHDWRDLQEIKNMLTNPECEAVEIYPAESRRVDSANQYHLWVFTDQAYRVPFGFSERLVSSSEQGGSKQRPLEGE